VTTGPDGESARAAVANAVPVPRPTATTVAEATPAATQRDGPLDHRAATSLLLQDIA
jgi:hypothetical protein